MNTLQASWLTNILKHKRQQVELLRADLSEKPESLFAKIYHQQEKFSVRKSFQQALKKPHLAIIAEIKRKSPSKGKLAEIADSAALAQIYSEAGAAAISVLTESQAFSGGLSDLEKVSKQLHATSLPILRKDFIIDELQIVEAILAGADAVLLIVSILGAKTKTLIQTAHQYGITALVEVHDLAELEIAIESGAQVIGVNNRNLTTLEVNPRHAFEFADEIPAELIKIAESGINTTELAKEYYQAGFDAVLIGEALVKAENRAQFMAGCISLTCS